MSWTVLIQTLLAFFGPFLRDLLDNLLKNRSAPIGATPVKDEDAVSRVFDALRGQTSRWNPFDWGKRTRINVGERIALKYAGQLVHSARTGAPLPAMDAADYDAIAA